MLIILLTLDDSFLIIFKTNTQNDISAEKPSCANPDHFIDIFFQPGMYEYNLFSLQSTYTQTHTHKLQYMVSLMWTIFKVFIEFVTILLLCYVCFFDGQASGILGPPPANTPTPATLGGEVLITGPPGKSLHFQLSIITVS